MTKSRAGFATEYVQSSDTESDSDSELWNSPLSSTRQMVPRDLKQGIVEDYRKSTILRESATFRVYVGRMTPDFANDVMEIYKKPLQKLCSPFSVKFENETSIGSGPVREFFSILMNMVINGFPLDGEDKPATLIFEGEDDHKVPVANSLLRSTGFYTLVGRMIAHSFLHSGPPVFGISQAIVDCMVAENDEEIPSLQVADISDIDLRNALLELTSLDKETSPSDELKEFLTQYRDEASILDTSLSGTNRHIIAQQIMLHNVITRRRSELKDLAEGLNEFGLLDLLKKNKYIVLPLLFPRIAASVINKDHVKYIIQLEVDEVVGVEIVQYMKQYVDLIDSEKTGPTLKDLLFFWTAWALLPSAGEVLNIRVDGNKSTDLLPESRTCFFLLVTPAYNSFDCFKIKMDKALLLGCKGFTQV